MAEGRGDAQHRQILEQVFEAVVVADASGVVVRLNPAAEALLGVSASAAVGLRVEEVVVVRDDPGGAVVPSPLAATLANGGPVASEICWIDGADGTPRPVAYRCAPLIEDGVQAGAIAVFADRTERERSHELLTRADRLASMGTMAASIAHEINNPLTYVMGNIEVVLATPGLPTAVIEPLRDVQVGARAIERIVRDLKLLSAPDHKNRVPIDVKSVVQRSLRMVAKEVRARGRLEAALSPTLPVFADAVALGQVVLNLVINAAHALEDAYDEEQVVRVSTDHDGLYTTVTVEDNGCGIPDEIRDRILDPFFTTKPLGEGSGLGLAVSHQIIRDFGGMLRVESELGVGTKMTVMLPAHTDMDDDEGERTITWSDRSYPHRRVLVIDDDPLVRRALASMLGRVHDVEVCASVQDALDRIQSGFGYDAILCDLMMSPLNGLEFVEALPAIAPDLVSRTAFVTGGVMSGSVRERVVRSGRQVAYKPFSVHEILSVVEGLALS